MRTRGGNDDSIYLDRLNGEEFSVGRYFVDSWFGTSSLTFVGFIFLF
jgi:hypothetical protein